MSEPMHELPESIVLPREEYRLQHAALEAALDVFDRFPEVDQGGAARRQVETALRVLLRRIWPFLDELDGE
ncbi:hypothetical protein ER308_02110 [Egibacter rhizosphaerae]|uniref:Uncharacterized protein n=1 Tax=Egibacter rhizosphaerae TaxID=1670831 RepID=A0A411YBD9_9ACTN|nr:hypothetical protein [Egibacter rhizosphaerae]QBI18477.1 hypothetical protein ER308_02110 [Egibacter rhizosphaerae]